MKNFPNNRATFSILYGVCLKTRLENVQLADKQSNQLGRSGEQTGHCCDWHWINMQNALQRERVDMGNQEKRSQKTRSGEQALGQAFVSNEYKSAAKVGQISFVSRLLSEVRTWKSGWTVRSMLNTVITGCSITAPTAASICSKSSGTECEMF